MIARIQKWLRDRQERKLLEEISSLDRVEAHCGALSIEGVIRRQAARDKLAEMRREP